MDDPFGFWAGPADDLLRAWAVSNGRRRALMVAVAVPFGILILVGI